MAQRGGGGPVRHRPGAGAPHPPGIRLAVVLSCHNVLEELAASDPAGKHTKSPAPQTLSPVYLLRQHRGLPLPHATPTAIATATASLPHEVAFNISVLNPTL